MTAATNAIKADQVRHNGFSENLNKDFIAVSASGEILARADTEDAARLAVPGAAAYFTGKDFKKSGTHPEPIEGAASAPVLTPNVPTTPAGLPISDALADDPTPEPGTRTHPLDDGTPFEGPQTVDPTGSVLQKIASDVAQDPGETPIKDALDASHEANTEAENAGRHAKTDELQKAQVDVLEEKVAEDPDRPARKGDLVLDPDGNLPNDKAPITDGSAFDPDGDGKVGGAPKGGNRKRKPAEK